MYCKNCGKKLEDDTKDVCLECESTINEGPIRYEKADEVKKSEVVNNTNNDTDKKTQGYEPKSKVAAGILAIFLGSLGIHNFYLGYNGKAIAQLLITLLSFGVFSFVSAIWGFIEGILILTGSITKDGNGNPLKDE